MGTLDLPHGPDDLDEDQRARMRYHVLAALRGRRSTLRDRLYDAVALAGLPAPLVVRIVVSATLVLGVVTSATVASAEALPNQPLYSMKLATEEVRLALAQTPEDRAAVRLSMAEHRLVEAQRLALEGLEPEAIVASSIYGADLASAAAELASVERAEPASAPVVAQLRQRLVEQQRLASRVAAQLAADPVGAPLAPVFRTVASLPPSLAPNTTLSEAIAQHAADVTTQLAIVADQLAGTPPASEAGEETGSRAATRRTASRSGEAAAAQGPGPEGQVARLGSEAARRAGEKQPSRRSGDAGPVSPAEGGSARAPAPEAAPVRAPEPARAGGPARPDLRAAGEAARRAQQEAEKAREAAKRAKEEAHKRPPAHGVRQPGTNANGGKESGSKEEGGAAGGD